MHGYEYQEADNSKDGYMCCLHDTPRTFDWCKNHCDRYYRCDTAAWTGDELNEDRADEGAGSPGSYGVTITETLRMVVTVDAGSPDKAEQIVSNNWRAGDYILDAENFVGVEYVAVPAAA